MRFAKLHGLGNDFVLFDLRAGGAPLPSARAVELCDRHRGIGADGVLTLLPGDRMLVQNADGSVPEMCGNGARCAALWIATEGCTRPGSGSMMLLTDAGPRPCTVEAAEARRGLVEVDMGIAVLSAPRRIGGRAAALRSGRLRARRRAHAGLRHRGVRGRGSGGRARRSAPRRAHRGPSPRRRIDPAPRRGQPRPHARPRRARVHGRGVRSSGDTIRNSCQLGIWHAELRMVSSETTRRGSLSALPSRKR